MKSSSSLFLVFFGGSPIRSESHGRRHCSFQFSDLPPASGAFFGSWRCRDFTPMVHNQLLAWCLIARLGLGLGVKFEETVLTEEEVTYGRIHASCAHTHETSSIHPTLPPPTPTPTPNPTHQQQPDAHPIPQSPSPIRSNPGQQGAVDSGQGQRGLVHVWQQHRRRVGGRGGGVCGAGARGRAERPRVRAAGRQPREHLVWCGGVWGCTGV